ncbi:MAG: thiolase family protein, partial [Alphaproteobacteria bacterium]|nr:thiolase family protein [Alphaproteobacteria bacterium]
MKREAYISGIGMSEVGVRLTRAPLALTVDAIREAVADAGLTLAQIDGVSTYPGKMSMFLGFSPIGVDEVIETCGLKTRWHTGAAESTAQLGAIADAAAAVRSGLARHVICFRTVYEAAALARPDEYPPMNRRDGVTGNSQWVSPFGAFSAACWTAQFATRHMKRYGMTREQLAQVALNDHRNAALNPRAIVKEPLTLEKYMAARLISTPFCLYDCDRFTDASTVVIVSAGDAIDEVKATPIRIAASAGSVERYSWDQAEWASAYPTGRDLWRNTDYKPKDVDTVQFYDGFAFQPITWLEGLGFCAVGEGGQFLEGGTRIALDGELPMNTGGGQLGWGRLHGF